MAATYDGHGRLDSYDRTNIGAQSYTYNGLGDRVRVDRPTDTRHFVYDAWGRVIAEYGASAGDVKAEFIWALPPSANGNSPFGGGDHVAGYAPLALIAETASSQLELYWVHGNHLGVPVVTTNALGQVVTPGNDFLRPGFPGQSEVLSDLYYNRARDYDPVLGRYIQADPIGLAGGGNPYLYAGADPVNLIDPTGNIPIPAICLTPAGGIACAAIAGAAIDLAFQIGDNLWNGRSVFDRNCYDWNSVLMSGFLGGIGGGVGGLGAKSFGREFSHGIADRYFRPLTLKAKNPNPDYKPLLDKFFPKQFKDSRWNGNYVTREFHAWTDPYRNLRGGKKSDTVSAPFRYLLRIPTAYAYPASAAAVVINAVNHEN